MQKEEMLSDDQLDTVTGGADAEPQDAYLYFDGSDVGLRDDTTKARMPGMQKYGNVTLKRGSTG